MKILFKIANIFIDLTNGFYSGFPVCCVINYARLQWHNYAAGERMKGIYGPDELVGYVRCLRCRKRNKRVKNIRRGTLKGISCRV